MAELLSRDYDNSVVTIGNKIRRLALNIMLYKGSEYAAVSGAMMVCTFSNLNKLILAYFVLILLR